MLLNCDAKLHNTSKFEKLYFKSDNSRKIAYSCNTELMWM